MDADLLVIGAGPAGVAAALRARELGASVALVEREQVGGTCLHRGCVPLVTSVELAHRLAERPGAAAGPASPEGFAALQRRQTEVVRQLHSGTRLYLEQAGVSLVAAEGRLAGPGTVEVVERSGRRSGLTGRAVLLALGSVFVLPELPGIDLPGVWTSDHALDAGSAPPDLVVYGGGFIGVELAQLFQAFGSRVTLVEPGEQLLPGEDPEIAAVLEFVLAESGIAVQHGWTATRLEAADAGRVAIIGPAVRLEADRFLVADCRRPALAGLPAELGLMVRAGALVVDDRQATSVPGVFAAGDLVGGRMLSHVARAQGIVAAEVALGRDARFDPVVSPRVYHVRPEVAAVGLTEAEAQAAGYQVVVGRAELGYNARALTLGQEIGLAKVVARRADGRILGVHLVGPLATEVIAQAVLALRLEALAEDLASIVPGHPTLAEVLAEAAHEVVGQLA